MSGDDLLKGITALPLKQPAQINSLKAKTATFEAAAADTPEAIEKAATQFEALLLQQMFNSMWSTVPKNSLFGGSKEEEYYRDMFNEALAQSVAEGEGIGVKSVIAKDIASIATRRKE
jgi:Rod binding domain-containing protein